MIQTKFDKCLTLLIHLSAYIDKARLETCVKNSIKKIFAIKTRYLDHSYQTALLKPFNILQLKLRRFEHFSTYLKLCSLKRKPHFNWAVLRYLKNIFFFLISKILKKICSVLFKQKTYSDYRFFSWKNYDTETINEKLIDFMISRRYKRSLQALPIRFKRNLTTLFLKAILFNKNILDITKLVYNE